MVNLMSKKSEFINWISTPFILLFGITLPFISLGIELTTQICADSFFDPIPTIWHVLLVLLVPAINLQIWLAKRKERTDHPMLLRLLNGVVIGISIFYSIVYAPLLPLSLIGILFGGLGLLGMTPQLALIASIFARRELNRLDTSESKPIWSGLWLGIVAAFFCFFLVELPNTLTKIGLQMASSQIPETKDRGIRWLRNLGNKDLLLIACYERSGRATDMIGFLAGVSDPVHPEEARKIYYLVTGDAFNSVAPPKLSTRIDMDRSFSFDPNVGGDTVAGRVWGLSMASSRIDGSLDPDAAVGYMEWTLVFKNDSQFQREARTQILLPPEGVVSRLTLWVNGEEREAAFAGRQKVREAYQQVVSQRRDPVLVTTDGPDRILMQCFPVPSKGEMKIRIGITAPLPLKSREVALLKLPSFIERNFEISENIKHSVWLESKRSMEISNKTLKIEEPKPELYALRGELTDAELATPETVIQLNRGLDILQAWTKDPHSKKEEVVEQTIQEKEAFLFKRIVLVVDTARSMRDYITEIADALPTLSDNIEVGLVLASNGNVQMPGSMQVSSRNLYRSISDQLKGLHIEGGADNITALNRAWDLAAGSSESAIVWIHGPQPVLLERLDSLEQKWERRSNGPHLFDIQVTNGSNRIAQGFDHVENVKLVHRSGRLREDLEKLFSSLSGRSNQFHFVREKKERSKLNVNATSKETSTHLARLWAHDEVLRQLSLKKGTDEAIKLAALYQLVTPVSGAVVLETAEQYERAGLKPVEPGSVPTIPEPEIVLLVLIATLSIAYALYRKRALSRT
jgi:hypothetical protein